MTTDATTASLWQNGPFLRMWTGQTASSVGTQLGGLAIPVLAVSVLQATEFQVGLPAGAWVDRWLKRRVMLFADLSRAVVLASVPIFFFAGILSIWQLIVVGAIVGVASVFFDVAYQSLLPVLVEPAKLGEGNSKLETTGQLVRIAGPALSGALLALVRPAVLVGIDALTFLFSFFALSTIRDRRVAKPVADRRSPEAGHRNCGRHVICRDRAAAASHRAHHLDDEPVWDRGDDDDPDPRASPARHQSGHLWNRHLARSDRRAARSHVPGAHRQAHRRGHGDSGVRDRDRGVPLCVCQAAS